MNKGLKIVFGIIFFPVSIYILIWKSKLSKAIKILLTVLWSPFALLAVMMIFAINATSRENQKSQSGEDSVTTIEEATEERGNPFMSLDINEYDNDYNGHYGLVNVKPSFFDGVLVKDFMEFSSENGERFNWITFDFGDGTGIYISTQKSRYAGFIGYWGEIDKDGGILKHKGIIEFDKDTYILFHGDSDDEDDTGTDVFDLDFFDRMTE